MDISTATDTNTNDNKSIPVIFVPLNILTEDGITTFPSVREITAPEKLSDLGITLDRAFANLYEFLTMNGATALMPKHSAPANGFS